MSNGTTMFDVFEDTDRLKIIDLLTTYSEAEVPIEDIRNRTNIPEPNLQEQLEILEELEIIERNEEYVSLAGNKITDTIKELDRLILGIESHQIGGSEDIKIPDNVALKPQISGSERIEVIELPDNFREIENFMQHGNVIQEIEDFITPPATTTDSKFVAFRIKDSGTTNSHRKLSGCNYVTFY